MGWQNVIPSTLGLVGLEKSQGETGSRGFPWALGQPYLFFNILRGRCGILRAFFTYTKGWFVHSSLRKTNIVNLFHAAFSF